MTSPRISCEEEVKREVPSFIEARPPLVLNPFMRPKPTKGKKLFTDVTDMEDSEFEEFEEPELVQIYVRLKPCKAPSIEVHSERSLITSLNTTTAGHGRRTQHNVSKMYTFSHIFGPDSNQKEIFERVVKDNLKKLPDGNSFTLLTYGASGSGKTFTLMGTVTSPGLVPRSLEYVFKLVEAEQHPLYKPDEKGAFRLTNVEQEYELKVVRQLRKLSGNLPEYRDRYRRMSAGLGGDLTNSNIDLASRRSHYVWVSFIEIYNEAVYDLLGGDRRNAAKLAIREDASGNVYVKGAIQAFVRSCDEAYDVLVAGKLNLQVAATGIHAQSSRSHCIFTITMLTDTENGMRSACVRLCDLAGCERAARTRNTGARMQESRAINTSLHVLERCLHTLRRKRTAAALVPYRESKLTRILGAGLSGTRGEAVSMVVTLNPSAEYANENKHVLQLAAVAKDIPISDTLVEYPSSMESSSRDTTIVGYTSLEIMLRAENERLLFELKQAQARNKELQACMEEKQAAHDKMLWEVMDETKAMYRNHYEAEIKTLQAKMDAMEEEYECRLRELSLDNPSQRYRDRIAELKKTIAILEKKLSDRESDVKELESLRACIEKNDAVKAEEKLSESEEENDEEEDVISLHDSDNDCLIPTLNKKEIKHVLKIRQSIIEDLKISKRASGIKDSSPEESDLEEPIDGVSDHDHDAYLTSESLNTSDTSDIDDAGFSTVKKATSRFTDDCLNIDVTTITNQEKDIQERNRQRSRETYCVPKSVDGLMTTTNQEKEIPEKNRQHGRETYCVPKSVDDIATVTNQEKEIQERNRQHSRETYCVPKSVNGLLTITNEEKEIPEKNRQHGRETYCVPKSTDDIATVTNQEKEIQERNRPLSRETYCVSTSVDDIATVTNQKKEIPEKNRQHSRETYCVPKSVDDIATVTKQEKEIQERNRQHSHETYCVPISNDGLMTTTNQDKEIPERNRQHGRETNCVPKSIDDIATVTKQENEIPERKRQLSRETYCVSKSVDDVATITNQEKEIPERNRQHGRETNCVPKSIDDIATVTKQENEIPERKRQLSRETYCVSKSVDDVATITNQEKEIPVRNRQHSRETYCVSTSVDDVATVTNQKKEIPERKRQLSRETYCVSTSVDDVATIITQENEILQRKRQLSCETVDSVAILNNQDKEIPELKQHLSREPYCILMSENLNIPKNKLQNEIPKSLKYDIVKDIDISKPNEISNSLKDMVDIAKNTVETKNPICVTSKILGLVKQSTEESNNSLVQFERLEMESRDIIDDDKKIVTGELYNVKPTKENRKFFGYDCLDKHLKTPVIKAKDRNKYFDNSNVEKSNLDKNLKTTVAPPVKKTYFFGESITRQADKTDSVKKNITSRAQDSIYIFEEFDSPQVNKVEIVETQSKATLEQIATLDKIGPNINSVNVIEKKSNEIKNTNKIVASKKEVNAANVINSDLEIMSADTIIEKETPKMEIVTDKENKLDNQFQTLEILNSDELQSQANCTKGNNTTVEFENIYKDISAPRATEFDLLISQESIKENQIKTENAESVDLKYNLRHKPTEKAKTERKRGKRKVGAEEILMESVFKCESSSKPNRRNLRLRRQNTTAEEVNLEDVGRKGKLEDIGNLQVQFSDVTMGLPAPLTTTKDIPSPEKLENEENSPPKQGIQSCPAKSITRSRRKLFTPRAEPLDESLGVAADSDDKVRVPRPSYQRPRARRKL